jgi:hypothetical protein
MNAGEINISVTASMQDFNATMSKVKDEAEATAQGFKARFKNKLEAEFGDGKVGKTFGKLIGIGFVDQLLRTVSDSIKNDTSILEALSSVLKSIPVVGAAFSIGEAIGDRIFGAADRAAQLLREQQQAARAGMLAAIAEQNKEERAASDRTGGLVLERRRLELEREFQRVKAQGDEQATARAEFQLLMDQQNLDLELRLAQGIGDAELNALLKLNEQKQFLLEDELLARLAAVEKERVARQDAEAEKAAKEAERIAEAEAKETERIASIAEKEIEAGKRVAEERARFEEDRLKDLMKAEDERIAAQTAGLGSQQTALGAFRFDAYPATEKRKNDEKMVSALEKISSRQFFSGGFT